MSLFSNNYKLFEARFPQMAALIPEKQALELAKKAYSACEIFESKSGELTGKFNGKALHSLYSPQKEAEKLASEKNDVFFLGWGLGYGAVELSKKNRDCRILVIESDLEFAFLPFLTTDLTELFRHKNLILLFGISHEEIIGFMETCKIIDYSVITSKAHTLHNQLWFVQLTQLFERNKEKEKINRNTLEKYGKLWKNNASKNIDFSKTCHNLQELENKFQDKNALILCAGPTLAEHLEMIKMNQEKLKRNFIIICVDTALRIVLKNEILPDFVVLMDSQYWNFRHLDFTETENISLITEISVFPSVFKKRWKEIYFCASFYPAGQKLESSQGISRTKLSSGGSVATSSWDFARFTGCKKIFMAGLDLGYPAKQTHIKGSTFETWAEQKSSRITSIDSANAASTFQAESITDTDYSGNKIRTDSRMKMYAWWFESRMSQFPQIQTYSLSEKSLHIPGIKTAKLDIYL